MNWSKCRQSAGVDARSERLQVVHCVRGEHSTSCFSDSLRLQSASMTGVKQARATRCAAEPSLRDGMSVQEASRCRQEQSWCRAGERGDRRIFQGWQPRTVTRDVRGRQKRERDSKVEGRRYKPGHPFAWSRTASEGRTVLGLHGLLALVYLAASIPTDSSGDPWRPIPKDWGTVPASGPAAGEPGHPGRARPRTRIGDRLLST